jgi:hypothetical protein
MEQAHYDLYCKLLIDTDEDRVILTSFVADQIFGNIDRWSISNDQVSMMVHKNEDFDMNMRNQEEEGYLYSRFYLEMEPAMTADQELYIRMISKLLEKLWGNGFKAVALCDFASVLPRNGGLMAG